MPLALIKNKKTVDPRNKASTAVFQLETAMGAAIESFAGAQAVLIPRTRFAPVKTCNDLLALRSDAYEVVDNRLQLAAACAGVPPTVKLDGSYKFVDQLDAMVPLGVPSLVRCTKLVVEGKLKFAADVVVNGEVTFKNASDNVVEIATGTYANDTVAFL